MDYFLDLTIKDKILDKLYDDENSCIEKNRVYLNIKQMDIDYIDTQLDIVYWYAWKGKKNQSNKVMVYLINDMVKNKNYSAIDYVLFKVNVNRLNSASMDALRRTTSKIKYLNFRNEFIDTLTNMYNDKILNYELSEKFMLEE